LPVGRFVAPLALVSIAERAARDEDALLTVDDLARWERRHGRIPAGAVVALHSGWEARLREPGRFLNADAAGVMHAPGFSREAAEFLVNERDVAGAATDTLSLDCGPSVTYDAHHVLLGAGRYGLENVASLDRVPPSGAVIVVGAPKHAGGTGGPARLLALY
ncbi:MAG TPA: cyclase family protein, partial [Longimicrobium sp.]|nr:cyclase family protein [Longimicrobium sp.]